MALKIQISDKVLYLNGRSASNHRDTSLLSLTHCIRKGSSKERQPVQEGSGKIKSDLGMGWLGTQMKSELHHE